MVLNTKQDVLIVKSAGQQEIKRHAERVEHALRVTNHTRLLQASTAIAISALDLEWQKTPFFEEATISLVITTILYERLYEKG